MRPTFFTFFLLFFSFSLFATPNDLLEKANLLFEKGLYEDAEKLYDSLIKKGISSENMLYKNAYIAERMGRQGEAIYYLRKIQKNYGNNKIEERIRIISETIDSEGASTVETHPLLDMLNRNQIWLLLTFFSLIVGFVFWFRFSSNKHKLSITLSTLAFLFLLQLICLFCYFFQTTSLVIVQKTAFYESPSFAANYHKDLISPGSVFNIVEKKDIWYKIEFDQKEYWIPFFAVKEL